MTNRGNNSLQTKDYISIGVFSLIYFVIAFGIGGIAQMTPVTFPLMPMIVALFAGSIFMLYTAKIPKKGAVSILGILAGILLFITGMFLDDVCIFHIAGIYCGLHHIFRRLQIIQKKFDRLLHFCTRSHGCVYSHGDHACSIPSKIGRASCRERV